MVRFTIVKGTKIVSQKRKEKKSTIIVFNCTVIYIVNTLRYLSNFLLEKKKKKKKKLVLSYP